MATFPVTYFRHSVRYPESGNRVQFGGGYEFASPPRGKDQRVFILTLLGMQYFLDAAGDLDGDQSPGRNLKVLEDFYNQHKLAFSFDFDHPVYGMVSCRFHRPLEIPEGIAGGDGLVPEFQVELVELP